MKPTRTLFTLCLISVSLYVIAANDFTTMFDAIRTGNIAAVKLLLTQGYNINTTLEEGGHGRSALIAALQLNKIDIAKILIDKGADVNFTTKTGITPLSAAIERTSPDIVKLLIAKGADLKAVKHPLVDLAASTSPLSPNAIQNAQLIIDMGINVNEKNRVGDTALTWAAQRLHFELAKLLIEKKADVNMCDTVGITPLMSAANGIKPKRFDMVKLLAENGADINATTNDRSASSIIRGSNALMFAIFSADSSQTTVDIVRYLVSKGADTSIKNSQGKTALKMAEDRLTSNHKNYGEIIDILKKAGAVE